MPRIQERRLDVDIVYSIKLHAIVSIPSHRYLVRVPYLLLFRRLHHRLQEVVTVRYIFVV